MSEVVSNCLISLTDKVCEQLVQNSYGVRDSNQWASVYKAQIIPLHHRLPTQYAIQQEASAAADDRDAMYPITKNNKTQTYQESIEPTGSFWIKGRLPVNKLVPKTSLLRRCSSFEFTFLIYNHNYFGLSIPTLGGD